jgi:hypothetical protein
MAELNITAASEALKLFYLPGLQYQLNNANPILQVVERDSKSVVGSEIRMALRYGRHGGVGNRADNGDLPVPNSRKTKQAKYETKNIFAHIQISDKTMKASRGDGAFASLLEADLADAEHDTKDNMARQCFGDGTGKLATLAAATTATTFTVDNVQYLVEGIYVDIIESNGNVKATQREVLEVDDQAKTVKLSGAGVTTVATDILVVHGNHNQELTGFGAVFKQNNTIYNIDRNTNKWFNPYIAGTIGTLSETKIQKAIDEVDRKAGGKTNFLVSSYGVRRAYQDLMTATKRTVEQMEYKGGYKTLAYNDMPFTVDKYAPQGTLYGMDLSTWALYHIEDFNWLDEDGAVLSRVPGKAVWSAALARYCDLGCSKPAGNFAMTGITEA